MIDFHTHILPELDDGSSSVEESLSMLSLYPDCVTDICLTPHFYPSSDNPDKFFKKREDSYNKLCNALGNEKHPRFHLGAEVHYYHGINRSEDMEQFRISDTRLILIEMPYEKWNMRMMDELIDLNRNLGLRPVLAHIDRYNFAKGQNWDCFLYYISKRGLAQVNSEAFNSLWSRRTAVSMIKEQIIHFIGTDAHNMTERKPDMDSVIKSLDKDKYSKISDCLEHNIDTYFRL